MSDAFVLDCSAILPLAFAGEADAASDRLHERLANGDCAWVPSLWHLEMCNVLVGALRRQRIDPIGITRFFSRLKSFNITTDSETETRAWEQTFTLAERHRLTAYDAAYLELAVRRGVPLATKDEALTAAAQTAGVKLCC